MSQSLFERVRKLQKVAYEQGLVIKEIGIMQQRAVSIMTENVTPNEVLGIKISK